MTLTKELLIDDLRNAEDQAKIWSSRVDYIRGLVAYIDKPEPPTPTPNANP